MVVGRVVVLRISVGISTECKNDDVVGRGEREREGINLSGPRVRYIQINKIVVFYYAG